MNKHTRDSIAAIAQLVTRAAHDGDAAAIRIFDSAAHELAAVVDAVRLALDFAPDEIVPLSYSGGVFHAGDADPRSVQATSGGALGRLSTCGRRSLSPSIGAAIYAAKLAAQPLSTAAMQRLGNRLREQDRG